MTDPAADTTARAGFGWRGRLLVWFLLTLVVTSGLTYVVARTLLLDDVDEAITAALRQEAEEFLQLAGGNDPTTGEPLGRDTRRLLELHLQRNLPDANETFVGLLGGEAVLRSADEPAVRLDEREDLVARWAATTVPVEGSAQSSAGTVRWLTVPVDGDPDGTMVFAWFSDLERAPDERAVVTVVLTQLVAGALLLLALGGVLTRGLSRPLATITATTRSIQATDLSRRLPVTGDDELGALAATINGLLDRLEAALASQRRFLAEASHELRTPITVVQGHLDVLDEDPDDRAASLEVVHEELDRMTGLVSDLSLLTNAQQLDFVETAPVDLEHLAGRIEQRVTRLGDRDWQVHAEPGTAHLDDGRILQAVLALADNAEQHTEPGDRIEIALEQTGAGIVVRVADTGPGIPEDLVDRVFERFERGGTRSEGSGLGLAIVQAIARAHGGRAEVTATGPGGTTMQLHLPARTEPT